MSVQAMRKYRGSRNTEAYCGEEDTACHAHKGRTARTNVMYASKRDQNRKWRFTLKNPITNG